MFLFEALGQTVLESTAHHFLWSVLGEVFGAIRWECFGQGFAVLGPVNAKSAYAESHAWYISKPTISTEQRAKIWLMALNRNTDCTQSCWWLAKLEVPWATKHWCSSTSTSCILRPNQLSSWSTYLRLDGYLHSLCQMFEPKPWCCIHHLEHLSHCDRIILDFW